MSPQRVYAAGATWWELLRELYSVLYVDRMVALGVDVRTSQEVAIGPFIGGALDVFGWHASDAALANAGARGADPVVYFTAGLALRLDIPHRTAP